MRLFYYNKNCQLKSIPATDNGDGTHTFKLTEEHFLVGILKDNQIFSDESFTDAEAFAVKYKDLEFLKNLSQTNTSGSARTLTVSDTTLKDVCCGSTTDNTNTDPMTLQLVTDNGNTTTNDIQINGASLKFGDGTSLSLDRSDITLNSDGTFYVTPFGGATHQLGAAYQLTNDNGRIGLGTEARPRVTNKRAFLQFFPSSGGYTDFSVETPITQDNEIMFPNKTGTVALLSDLNNLEVLNTRPQNPTPGRIFFNSQFNDIEYYDGSNWRVLQGTIL